MPPAASETYPCPRETAPLPVARQRVQGTGAVTSKWRDGHRLDALRQDGSARIRLPRSDAHALSAVLLNTAGGLTGDDEIRWRAEAGAGSRLSVATAASEKVYRTHGPAARQRTALAVGPGARLDWLPQETILFDGARLERTLHVELAAEATLLAVEAIAFGRRASGEKLCTVGVRDRWHVYREGELLHAESFRLDESPDLSERGVGGDRGVDVARSAARSRGALHGAGAMATALYCAPDGAEALDALTEELHALVAPSVGSTLAPGAAQGERPPDPDLSSTSARARGGVSAMDGRIVLRLLAPSSFELRRILLPCLERLQGEAPLPRVWHV